MMTIRTVSILVASDIIHARKEARDMAKRLKLGIADQTRLATAISELTRNIIQYAGSSGGECRLFDESTPEWVHIRVEVEDWGPGIPDINKAMQDGYSTGGGLGAGLPGTRRLMDKFEIQSQPGHTLITLSMLRRRM